MRGLEDYVPVNERVQMFYDKYPLGSLQATILKDDGKVLQVKALAFRGPDDVHPGVGHAEEIRGSSMVNKTSALENAETSAWGRALAAVGIAVSKGIASRHEVERAKAKEKTLAEVPVKELEAKGVEVLDGPELVSDEGITALDAKRSLYEKRGLPRKALNLVLKGKGLDVSGDDIPDWEKLTREDGLAVYQWINNELLTAGLEQVAKVKA